MKKSTLAVVLVLILFSSAPSVAFATINSLNGLTGTTQTFATSTAPNSPHLLIQSSGTVHTFKWNGTPWLLNQGGTGATSFATSSIPFINNGVFSENNLQFFWDAINNILNVGGTTTPATKLSIRGSGSLGLFNAASSTGVSLFYISGNGNVGVSTTSPSEKLEVVGNGKFSGSLQANTLNVSATSTMTGPVGIGNTNPKSALDVSGAMYSRLVTAGSNIDWNAGNVQSLTLTSSPTLTFSNGQAGGEYKLLLKQDGTGSRTVTWPASVKWPNNVAPTLTTSLNSTDVISFVYDGTDYFGSYSLGYNIASTLTNNLIAYWKLDESSGNASDSIGSNTLINIATSTYAAGKINNAAYVDGSNYFTTTSTITPGTDFSSSVWVYKDDTTEGPVMGQGVTVGYLFTFASCGSDYCLFVGAGSGVEQVQWNIGSKVNYTGIWTHLVLTYSGTTATLYVNGVSQGTRSISQLTPITEIGRGQSDNMFPGRIDEVGMWSRALSSTEVTQLYNSGSGIQYPF